jgi:ParB family chromosome partitioning protein
MVGKSRSHVANTLRLLKLPPSIRSYIFKGKLDAGHARMLVGQPNAEKLAEEIVARGLNVRQVEEIARQESDRNGKPRSQARKRSAEKNADTLALEKRLSDALGLVVSIDDRGESGVVSIRYGNLEQLDDLAQRLENKRH